MTFEIIFVILVFIVFIGIVIYLVLRGDSVVHNGKHLATKGADAHAAKGYGTYQKVYESPCSTADGKCNNPGIKWVTEYCAPHPTTGRGCLDENGEQTFAPRSTTQTCRANCRSFILQETTTLSGSVCNYDSPFDTFNCVPANASAFQYRSFTCIKNDTIGDNTCTYKCGSGGIQSNGIHGDADPSLISYIPICAANPGATVTFNHIPWNTIYNLGKNGYVTSLGYTIKNIITSDGTVDKTQFSISPAYPPWGATGYNTISYQDLINLDQNLILYENCTPTVPKPQCDNYYVYTPEEPESDVTRSQNPSVCKLNGNYYPIKECFYNPWYSLPGDGVGGTGLAFNNPYVGSTGGNTGAAYTWTNIGNYGYIAIPTTCSDKPTPAKPGSTAGTYIIPNTPIDNSICLDMTIKPRQCSNNYTTMFQVSPSVTAAQIEGDTGTPVVTSSYPQNIGGTYFLCVTEYPDGNRPLDLNSNTIPGCIQTCQYLPNNNEINFYSPDSLGNTLGHTALYDLIGKYVSINFIDSSNKEYFLTINNIMCPGSNPGNLPLQNCLNNPSSDPIPLLYVYTGGTGIAAGNYWSKNNCDEESIVDATNLRLLFSPRYAMNSPATNTYGFACDIYGYVGGLFGYLSTSATSSSININNAFFGSNIIANLNYSSTASIYFNVLAQGEQIPNVSYTDPSFMLLFNSNTNVFKLSGYNPQVDFLVDTFQFNAASFVPLTFTTEANKTTNQGYYKTLGYNEPLIKSPGTLYAGTDVSRTITIQRSNACYTYNTCYNSSNPTFCYQDTCNLFYEYTPEFC